MVPRQQRAMLSSTQHHCAVLGKPIAHSLSPVLHRTAYAELGLDWTYSVHEVDEAGLAAFVDGVDASWRGLSLTMPLKRAAIPLCDEVDEVARTVTAVNTLLLDENGRRRGTNTDVPGMVAALRERGVDAVESALLLGVGATACSAVAALASLGARTVMAVARNAATAGELRAVAERCGVEVALVSFDDLGSLDAADVAVSTVPDAASAVVADTVVKRVGTIFEVLYDPWPTVLAAAGEQAGRTVVGGFDLLVHQAALQVELMTERTPAPLAAMRSSGVAALRARWGK
ncbi:shikimate dehydrogenase [Tenggerimyces flavus]|uniref:Shikimate dehydrogenase n=1 Tax=Tenggerimyces flavus TaxID=1708749 RepID=A0ABV7YE36_9ACTN|nr:shikimate dehydrogenase [Tenggerimyces flavus]MBM7787930.1 shikimate dehydrogenase [Tenggerimyces flavus]